MKAKIYFLAMALVALLMVGCSDDDGIQLTQDEIIGDINTGKQVGIKGNSLVIYTTLGACVNVQGVVILAANKKPITPQTMTGTVEQATKRTA